MSAIKRDSIRKSRSSVSVACLVLAGSLIQQDAAANAPTTTIRIGNQNLQAVAMVDRMSLCKAAAAKNNLKAQGLDWRDVYAIVNAETDWAARDGMGRNKHVSRGLAQLDDATAKILGVDPHDHVQAIGAVASLLFEAAAWSKSKGYTVGSGSLSVYYNLSTSARNAWDGSINALPFETQQHIANFRQGRLVATSLDRDLAQEIRRQKRLMLPYLPRR